MADEADLADEFQERFLQDSLQRQLSGQRLAPKSTGKCLYCEEPLAPTKRWCDSDCRDDWEREENARRRRLGISPVQMPAAESDD